MKEKKDQYEKPQIKYIGRVSELTKSGGGYSSDGQWSFFTQSTS